MIGALLIDLDDTLYDERTYVLSGFRAVAAELARQYPHIRPRALTAVMTAELDARGRGKVFDRALAQAGLPADPGLVRDLVQLYREHRPQIRLWPGVEAALVQLRRDWRLAVVTDGLPMMQRRKVEALGLPRLVDDVLLCWEHEAPKPSPVAYRKALQRFGFEPAAAVVIGDNPHHDMAAAAAVGCAAIRVRTGRFADLPADASVTEVADFAAAAALLQLPQGLRNSHQVASSSWVARFQKKP